jgi:hypothetical protein
MLNSSKKANTEFVLGPIRILMTDTSLKEQAFNFYLSKAYDLLSEAEQYYEFFKYPESIMHAHESMDSAIRAICRSFDLGVTDEHSIDAYTLAHLADKLNGKWKELQKDLLGIMPSLLSHSLELDRLCKYGTTKGDVDIVPPNLIFTRDYCERILSDTTKLANMLHEVDMRNRWRPE